MIHQDTHDETLVRGKTSIEDTIWIVSGVIISLSLLGIIYFALTLFTAF